MMKMNQTVKQPGSCVYDRISICTRDHDPETMNRMLQTLKKLGVNFSYERY